MTGPRMNEAGTTGPWPPAEVGMSRWVGKAACAGEAHLPWTSDGDLVSQADQEEMTSACSGCPVLSLCAAAADHFEATFGFWAGRQRDDTAARTDRLEPTPAVVWVPHRTDRTAAAGGAHRWVQAAMAWPPSAHVRTGGAAGIVDGGRDRAEDGAA